MNGDGIPDFSNQFGYGRINIERLVYLAYLSKKRDVIVREKQVPDDIFKRNQEVWSTPDITINSNNRLTVSAFNRGTNPATVTGRVYTVEPRTFPLTTDWQQLGQFTISNNPPKTSKAASAISLNSGVLNNMFLLQLDTGFAFTNVTAERLSAT
jgi:hypothetical protein